MREGGPIGRIELPASGIAVVLHQPTGYDDLVLSETQDDGTAALALALALARGEDGAALDWPSLPASDLDLALLRLRQAVVGDRIASDLRCHDERCASRVEISFSIDAYLAHHRPAPPGRRLLPCSDAPSWYHLPAHAPTRFRVPTVSDRLAAARQIDPERALVRACLSPQSVPARLRRRAEAALDAIAPALSSELSGQCPECGAAVSVWFEPLRYCLRELRDRARYVFEEVDTLASRYHWSERRILALPNTRRAHYVEFAGGGWHA